MLETVFLEHFKGKTEENGSLFIYRKDFHFNLDKKRNKA